MERQGEFSCSSLPLLLLHKPFQVKFGRMLLFQPPDMSCFGGPEQSDHAGDLTKKKKLTPQSTQIHAMRCLNLLLQRWPQLVSQCMLENLLSTIAITASQFLRLRPSDHTAELYVGLSRLSATTFDYHRPKLGGRYHLILPALQSLLRPLFVPFTLVATSRHISSAFNATHANAYARLLTTLCEPSPSAVAHQKHRHKATLNDETKRAKDLAGQHLHYLVMTYCDCQLNGKLAAEGMKEALEPGLWAVLGCMGEEIKQTVNAGMDSRGRAVWKKLYEDWKKFGRWQAG